MPDRRSYKTDESFLEKLAIGASGTRFVFQDLQRNGHRPVELERGSQSFKLWKEIKIKRVRVPDLLCTACGIRFESRAKTKLEISMSHSTANPERGWDYGMLDSDQVALVGCSRTGERPVDWTAAPPVQYLSVGNLREAFRNGAVRRTQAKGAQEGFEIRLTWPAAVAQEPATVTLIDDRRLAYQPLQGRSRTIILARGRGPVLTPTVAQGQHVEPNQILAAVVPVSTAFLCRTLTDPVRHFLRLLASANLSDRYSAIKGLSGHLDRAEVAPALSDRMRDAREHIFVRLEAAANLLRMGAPEALDFFKTILQDEYPQHRLEAVIILGELPSRLVCPLLATALLDRAQHPEIRAGAAWSLGELRDEESLAALTQSLEDTQPGIRVEAARALAKLARVSPGAILTAFDNAEELRRPGLAWSLSKAGCSDLDRLLPLLTSLDARQWGAWIIGSQPSELFVDGLERLRAADPEIYFTATVLWKVMSSWIYGLEEY